MNSALILAAVALTVATMPVPAHAQTATPEQKAAARERIKSMTPEERAAAKEKAKAKWDAMSPEEQEAAKKRLAEKRPRLADRLATKQAGAASSPK